MCGIIGYIGQKEANPILLQGLERLEYRGYDSAGICTIHNGSLHLHKAVGRVHNLKPISLPGMRGIAHTRWATHGKPSDKNAHPFADEDNEFAIVHNGIIENYLELKEELRKQGVNFSSDTDSEVIVHLIAKLYQGNLLQATLNVIRKLHGAYAFCVLHKKSNELIGARNGSPLVLGIGQDEHFLASDVSALVEHTKQVIYLNDFEVARLTQEGYQVFSFQGQRLSPRVAKVEWDMEQAQKQGYKHFMLKEIFEQPKIVQDSWNCVLPVLPTKRIVIVACGTASYAGLVGKYLIEKIAKVPVQVEIASEFRYKEPLFSHDDLILAISQSGETADTLAAVRLAKQHGAKTMGLINVVDSTIAREVDEVVYTRAGQEIGVASTKAFSSQVVCLYTLAHRLAGKEPRGNEEGITNHLREVLGLNEQIKQLAQKYYKYQNFLYIGRNVHYPLALEGALKLKEISYIHAEAYPAGELKHGPIALVSEDTPTVAICPQDDVYDKTFSNIQEIKARSGKVIVLATEGDEKIKTITDDVIYLPKVDPLWYPLLEAIPLQLFAYHIADIKGCDCDHPRNLAKSCTVE